MNFKVGDWVQGCQSLRIGIILSIESNAECVIDWKINALKRYYYLGREVIYLNRIYLVCKDCKSKECPSLRRE